MCKLANRRRPTDKCKISIVITDISLFFAIWQPNNLLNLSGRIWMARGQGEIVRTIKKARITASLDKLVLPLVRSKYRHR